MFASGCLGCTFTGPRMCITRWAPPRACARCRSVLWSTFGFLVKAINASAAPTAPWRRCCLRGPNLFGTGSNTHSVPRTSTGASSAIGPRRDAWPTLRTAQRSAVRAPSREADGALAEWPVVPARAHEECPARHRQRRLARDRRPSTRPWRRRRWALTRTTLRLEA